MRDIPMTKEARGSEQRGVAERGAVLGESGGFNARLLNPLLPLFGGGAKYPDVFAKMFPTSPTTALLAAQTVFIGGAAALLAAGLRASQQDIAEARGSKSSPAHEVASSLNTTFTPTLSPKGLSKGASAGAEPEKVKRQPMQTVYYPGVMDASGLAVWGIPLAASALLATAAYRATDSYLDAARNDALSRDLTRRRRALANTIVTRARVAKGTATEDEVDRALREADRLSLVKSAAEDAPDTGSAIAGGAVSLFGLMLLLAGLGGGVAAYNYVKDSDPDNVRYKAMRDGLRAYTREKALQTPVTILPSDSEELFRAIDEPGAGKSRKQPAALLNPITDPMADMRVRDLPERPDGRAAVPVTL